MKQYTVTEITKEIKNLLEGRFDSIIAVSGEISGFSRSPNGHCYFTLKDVNAKIRVALFKHYASLLKDYTPKNGDKVSVIGDITLYEPDGSYQLLAKKIEYDSCGDIYQKFLETKKKLEEEGLFDEKYKKSIPEHIKRIAVLTSMSGAAIRDFVKIAKDRDASFIVDVWSIPVQGIAAVPYIESALNSVGRMVSIYDAVVLMRGGGSAEDLALFNEERIARGIFASLVPVISAIGHERDFSIADFSADKRAATPTEAAVFLTEKKQKHLIDIDKKITRIERYAANVIGKIFQRFDYIMLKLDKHSPFNKIKNYEGMINLSIEVTKNIMFNSIRDIYVRLQNNLIKLKRYDLRQKVLDEKRGAELLTDIMKRSVAFQLQSSSEKLTNLILRLKSCDPDNVLKRGYALLYKNESPVVSVNGVDLTESLQVRLSDGILDVSVTGKKITGG